MDSARYRVKPVKSPLFGIQRQHLSGPVLMDETYISCDQAQRAAAYYSTQYFEMEFTVVELERVDQ